MMRHLTANPSPSMANVPVCALTLSPTPGVAQGDVYLLAVDSISDLHSIPLDTERPQGEEVILDASDERSTSAPPDKPEERNADPPAARSTSPCTSALLTFLIILALVNVSLLLYILHLYRSHDRALRALAEKLDAQTDSLQQWSTRQESR